MKFVIFAEVVRVKGDCPRGHVVGQKLPFPTAMSEGFMCPAAFNNIFPFLRLSPPPCINANDLRCPDWDNEIHFSVD
jgi:uncharacterized repeat protein (TIGR04076 family)